MRSTLSLAAAGVLAVGVSASENYLGFSSGATFMDQSAKFKKDFEEEFKAAQSLKGAPGDFNAARLYTNIQAYSEDTPIEAFEAAMSTETKLLLGVWASGTDSIDKELSALKKAVDQYGEDFTKLVIGISIGSEDLYRNSVTGVTNKAGIGANPDTIVGFIKDFKDAFKGTGLKDVSVGHVDTWDAWGNGTNSAVMDAVDWVGVDEYPYFEVGKGNSIKEAPGRFDIAFEKTVAAANGKPVWVTETGWPASGPTEDKAVASVENAKYYWDNVGCRKLFGKVPTFWFTMRDTNPDDKAAFAITEHVSNTPKFNLTCPTHFDVDNDSSSSSSSSGSTKTSSPSSTGSGSSGSGSASATATGSGSSATGSAAEGSDASNTSGAETESTTVPDSGVSSLKPVAIGSLALVAALFTLL